MNFSVEDQVKEAVSQLFARFPDYPHLICHAVAERFKDEYFYPQLKQAVAQVDDPLWIEPSDE